MNVVADVMKFQMPRIGTVPLFVGPSAFRATVTIPNKHCPPDRIWNSSIVNRALSILLKHVDADGEVWSAGISGDDRPTVLRPELTNTASPFRSIFRDVSELFSGYGVSYVMTEKLKNLISYGTRSPTNLICHTPSQGRFAILLRVQQYVFLWAHSLVRRRTIIQFTDFSHFA